MRRHRLLLLLAPGFAWSNVALAFQINVGAVTETCVVATPANCDTPSLATAILVANTTPGPHTITIDAATYAPLADAEGHPAEYNLPAIVQDTTIESTQTDFEQVKTLPFRIRALQAVGVTLTVRNLRVKSGETFHAPTDLYREMSAIDVVDGALVGENLVLEDSDYGGFYGGFFDGRQGRSAVFARESSVTLTRFVASGFSDGPAILLEDMYDAAAQYASVLTDGELHDNSGTGYGSSAPAIQAHAVASLEVRGTTFENNYNEGYYGGGPAVHIEEGGVVLFDNATFTNNTGGIRHYAYLGYYGGDAGSLTVQGSHFQGNEGPSVDFVGRNAPVTVRDTTFVENWSYGGEGGSEGAVSIRGVNSYSFWPYDESFGTVATLEDVTFTDNYGSGDYYCSWNCYIDPGAADLSFSGVGSLVADRVVSTGSWGWNPTSAKVQGDATFRDSSWSVAYGGEGESPGRMIHAMGGSDLTVLRGAFTGSGDGDWNGDAGQGGAIYATGADLDTTYVQIRDSAFTETSARNRGGAIAVGHGVILDIADTVFDSTYAGEGGAISLGEDPWNSNYGEDVLFLGTPTQLNGSGLTFTNTLAGSGGALQAWPFTYATLTDSTFTGTKATSELYNETGLGFYGAEGYGGAVAVFGTTLELHDVTMTDVHAGKWGGAVFSGDLRAAFDREWYGGYYGGIGPMATDCSYGGEGQVGPAEALQRDTVSDGAGASALIAATVVLDGVSVDTSYGGRGASIGYFGFGDAVTITGSTFTSASTDPTEAFSFEPVQAGILLDSVASFHMSCSTICTSAAAGYGAGVFWFDQGGLYPQWMGINRKASLAVAAPSGDFYPTKDVRGTVRNNVFQNIDDYGGEGGGSAVALRFCDLQEETYGELSTNARGQVDLVNNTFVDNTATYGHIALWTGDVRVDLRNNVMTGGEVGLAGGSNSRFLTGGFNLYGDLVDDAVELDDFPEVTATIGTPVFRDHTPGTCGGELYLEPASPGYDAGDPELLDFDGSTSNVGAFGGPGACIPDLDGDGFNAIIDCDETLASVNPGANEIPYDGIDQDCDGSDWCDVDGDGFISTACVDASGNPGTDCNDADDTIYPGATEIPNDGIDQDCDGYDECTLDADNDGYISIDCPGGNDCDDSDATIYPGADEVPYDDIDQDCDGEDLIDVDCDGFVGVEAGGDDCDDNNAAVYPGAPENPFLDYDQDCDGEAPSVWAQGGCGCDTPASSPLGGAWLLGLAAVFARRRRSSNGGE